MNRAQTDLNCEPSGQETKRKQFTEELGKGKRVDEKSGCPDVLEKSILDLWNCINEGICVQRRL